MDHYISETLSDYPACVQWPKRQWRIMMSIASELKKRSGQRAQTRTAPSKKSDSTGKQYELILMPIPGKIWRDAFDIAKLLTRSGVSVRTAKKTVDNLYAGISAFVKVPYITNISRFKKQMMSQNIAVHSPDKHPVDIKALRKRLGASQVEFAGIYGLDVATLRNWEQGRTEPDGPATVLLRIIENDPEATLKLLYKEFQGQLG